MKVNITVPDNLNEIVLEDYQKFIKIQESNENSFFLQQKMVEIFCGIKSQDVLLIKYTDVEKVTSILNEMFDSKPELVKTFSLNGIEYGFIPDLNSLSFGEYIDLDTYMGDWQNIHIAMNVLYRPIKQKQKDKYIIEDYNLETKDALLDMPLDAVLSAVFFFFNLGKDCASSILNYLNQEDLSQQVPNLDLQKNGDGINHFMLSLDQILQDLKISQN